MKNSKQDLMFEHVSNWKQRGDISQADFAKEIGLTKGVFNYWVGKFNNTLETGISNSGFVELTPELASYTVSNEQLSAPNKTEVAPRREIEIRLPGGVQITIPI